MVRENNVISFDINKYIKISDFGKMNLFNEYSIKNGEQQIVNSCLNACIIGCIEGNIEICLENRSCSTWLGARNISFLPDPKHPKYLFFSIYSFVKSNCTYYNFIKKYFDLWHSKEQSNFTYDDYHKIELNNNFQKLLKLINTDIEQALEINDYEAVNFYNSLHRRLTSVFANNMNCA
ncbi:MAG: hypothetical protein WBJ13_00310 [Sedimentibacter sp.]